MTSAYNKICHVRVTHCCRHCELADTQHCRGLGLGYMFVADFRYRLIRRALIFARFSAIGMGPAYTWEGLYVSIYGS